MLVGIGALFVGSSRRSSIRPSDASLSASAFSFSNRTSRPRLWQYQNTKSSTSDSQIKRRINNDGLDVLNNAKLQSTLAPMKAGHLSLSTFMIDFNIATMAPGFVTNSLRLGSFVAAFAAISENPPPAAPAPTSAAANPCASLAAARTSGAREPVNLVGRDLTSFCMNGGRLLKDFCN